MSSIYTHTWKPGINKSDSKLRKVCKGYASIHHGIHVFRNKVFAKGWANTDRVVVEFTANKKDLLGANRNYMVFKQVELSKREYNRLKRKPALQT